MANDALPARQHRDVGHGFTFYAREYFDYTTRKTYVIETFVPNYGRCRNCPENGPLVAAPTTHAGPSMTYKRPRSAGSKTNTTTTGTITQGHFGAAEGGVRVDGSNSEVEEVEEDMYEDALELKRVRVVQKTLDYWVLHREIRKW